MVDLGQKGYAMRAFFLSKIVVLTKGKGKFY